MPNKKPKNDATKNLRINMIIDLINKKTPYNGITVQELAEKLEVSERQIYRDLSTIKNDLRTPLVEKKCLIEGILKTHYYLEVGYLPSISPERAVAIFLGLLQQQGSALTGQLNEIKDNLVSTLFKYHYNPKELAVEKLQNRIHFVVERLAEPERIGDLFTKLMQGIQNNYRLKICYFTARNLQETERVVEPYGLICKRQNWYLVANCLKRQDIRVFRVDQIKETSLYTSEKFDYPADFKLSDYMADSWGVMRVGETCLVKLKFSSKVAFRVKNMIYHGSQKTEQELADGSIIVAYKVCGIKEMKTWIIQWGNAVEVLEPEWLRKEMCQMAAEIISVYE